MILIKKMYWSLLVISLITTACFGRAVFTIGGPQGNSWQGLIVDKQADYMIIDSVGTILQTLPVTVGSAETGIDTMIDYTGNALRPIRIDPNENLALTLDQRNGNLFTSVSTGYTREAAKEVQVMIDGDPQTATLRRVEVNPFLAGLNIAYIKNTVLNLGAELPINRIIFYPRPGFEENYLEWYEIGVADNTAPFRSSPGEEAPGKRWYQDINRTIDAPNDPAFDVLERNSENLDVIVDLQFPTRDLRWIGIRPVNPVRDWEIAEVEVYGDGYVSKTTYRSGVLDFGRPVSWSKVRWSGAIPENTRLILRTRSGSTPQPSLFWKVGRTGKLERVSKDEYITAYQVGLFNNIDATHDIEHWSFWSTPYDLHAATRDSLLPAASWKDGTTLLSPGPSQYLQLEVVMFSDGPVAPHIDELSLLFAEEPAAQVVYGEVWPNSTDSFEPHTFTYIVRPVLQPGDLGFDRLEIFTQIPVEAVHSVMVDGKDIMDRYPPIIKEDRILISFDQLNPAQDTEKQIEIVFDARVLRFGAEFTGWVYNSYQPNIKQQVKAGNATFRFAGDGLSINTPVGGALVQRLSVHPIVFSPNDDGINDHIAIKYDLRDIESPRQITLKIFNLAGHIVQQVATTTTTSGSFVQRWDGRNKARQLVPPGTYLYQISLDSDDGNEVATGTLSVAY